MIRLTKGAKPEILIQKEAEWTQEYSDFKEKVAGIPKVAEFRYRHEDIKASLRSEANDKCFYCEAKISHVFPGQTEHILPVVHRRELVVNWENLAYVCEECNREKGPYYSVAEPLLNPYIEDPASYLLFLGPMVVCRGIDGKGYRTVLKLKLQKRTALFERRAERLLAVEKMILLYESKPAGPTKELMKDEIIEEASPDKEYSAFVREFIIARCGWPI